MDNLAEDLCNLLAEHALDGDGPALGAMIDALQKSGVYDTIRKLRHSRDFYARRCEALQAIQSQMRDPERKAVCDILANGETYVYAREQGAND